MKRNRVIKAVGLILAMLGTQGGCMMDPRGQSNARLLEYRLVKDETTIDPVTGETVMTSTWEYESGYRTTTTKRLPKGNEQRQWDRPPRPDPIVVD